MIKKFLEEKAFYYNTKQESYTPAEVSAIINDYKNFVVSFDEKITNKISDLEVKLNKAEATSEESAGSLEALTKEKEELQSKLDAEISKSQPLLEKAKQEKALELLKGKVVEGSELDVFNLIEEKLADANDDNRDELLTSSLEEVFTSKSYFKPAEVQEPGEVKEVIKTNKVETPAEPVANDRIISGIAT